MMLHSFAFILGAVVGSFLNVCIIRIPKDESVISPPSHCPTVFFVALGENGSPERIGQAEIHFVPYQRAPEAVARYYQAADIYIHAARADTFPNTILEALACGTPVIATAVGGIPEQVKALRTEHNSVNSYGQDHATGFLVSPGNAEELAARIQDLLGDDVLQRLSINAAVAARQRFNLERQVDTYPNG
jgi:glycosyltransferase involved in cell wall biosynthesis